MKFLGSIRSFAATLLHRSRIENEMNEELHSHILNRTDDLERSGLSHEEADRCARIEFGAQEKFKEECRESLGVQLFVSLVQDLRFGLRMLRKSFGFTVVAVLSLALGVGANTAIFSLVYAILLRPLPYPHPEQLVGIFEDNLQRGVKVAGCDYDDVKELRSSGVFSDVAALSRHELTLTGAGDPTEVGTVDVTPEIFPLFNVRPLMGRYLFPEDVQKGAAPAVVLSEGLWRTRFGANPDLPGNTIMLDQQPFTVVGIMPASFRLPFVVKQEIWIPISQDPLFSGLIPRHGIHGFAVMGRLNPGLSIARAQSAADSVDRSLVQEFPAEDGGWAIHVAPLQETMVDTLRAPLLVLLAAVGLVLLLACVNIANLLLARATSRARELAVRQALGAERGRLIRQLLTESTLLGLLGAILGVGLAYFTATSVALLVPRDMSTLPKVQIDGSVLSFALLLSLAATIAFGLVPALLATSSNMQSDLKDSAARSGSGGGRLHIRRFLAAAEIALAAVLVVGAGLLVRSLLTITEVNPGFNVANILKAEIALPRYQYSTPQQWTAFSNEFLDRIHSQPGMQDSAFAAPMPLADDFVNLEFSLVDHAALPPETPNRADYVTVSPEYFHVMGIPLLRGRLFTSRDSDMVPPVTIISESFARLYFQNEDPLGKKLGFGFPRGTNVTREIVGVVGNVRNEQLTQDPGPMMYVPFAQAPLWGGEVVVKSTLPPAALVGTIREVVRSMDKDLPVTHVASMPEVLDAAIARPKLRTWLISSFGIVALLLAAIGVFGVVSYSVASRTREFGVRAALGASPGSIGGMILKEGLQLGGIGLGLGLAAALGFVRLLKSELYGVNAYDPTTFFISGAVLITVALVACYIPARRAMRVDPMVALRYE